MEMSTLTGKKSNLIKYSCSWHDNLNTEQTSKNISTYKKINISHKN